MREIFILSMIRNLITQHSTMKLKMKKGIMQDASFITSDPGHAKSDTRRRSQDSAEQKWNLG